MTQLQFILPYTQHYVIISNSAWPSYLVSHQGHLGSLWASGHLDFQGLPAWAPGVPRTSQAPQMLLLYMVQPVACVSSGSCSIHVTFRNSCFSPYTYKSGEVNPVMQYLVITFIAIIIMVQEVALSHQYMYSSWYFLPSVPTSCCKTSWNHTLYSNSVQVFLSPFPLQTFS